MKSAIILSLVGATVAQMVNVNGVSMVTIAGSDATPTANNDYSYYGSSAPPQYTSDAASSSYAAPPSQYTTPPSYNPSEYSSMTSGGYKSMDCGYGYSKAYDGSCQSMSWVRSTLIREGNDWHV